jgi:hypothetical protein
VLSQVPWRAVTVIAGAVVFVAVSGCTASPTPAPSAGGQTYSSMAFVLPLTLTVDHVLRSPPDIDERNLLTWYAVASGINRVRFLVPVELYRPGSATPEAPPTDYLTYVQTFTRYGAEISEVSNTTVDGHPATLMNLTWTVDASHPEGYFDGALGCRFAGADHSEGCYGPQPYAILRLAVIQMGETTLLAWAALSRPGPERSFAAMFERMLGTVRFDK